MTSYAMLYRTVRSVRVCMEFTFFFVHWPPFLFWPRVFSRGLGCGACRGPACTHGASLGPGRACSGHSKSRELASNHGIAFRRDRANQIHGKPHNRNYQQVSHILLCITARTSGAATLQQKAFPSVAATHKCFCVRVCVRVRVCHRTYQGIQ